MNAEAQPDKKVGGNRPPALVGGPERRRIERKLQDAGVLCQPEVSVQYQTIAKRAVLRGVESGGASREIGRYVTFCGERGESLSWLQPIDSVATNGRHAIVIAESLVSVDVFRVRNTYEILITKHRAIAMDGRRCRVDSSVVFRGRQGYLPLDLAGSDRRMAGQILPEFFNKAGEAMEIPAAFVSAVTAAVSGANCVGCTHQHYLRGPQVISQSTATETSSAVAESA